MPHVYLSYDEIDLIMGGSAPSNDALMERLAKVRVEPSERDRAIVSIAREQHQESGKIEIDDPADGIVAISEGDDNGAYVLAWVYAGFSGTELDKEAEENDEA